MTSLIEIRITHIGIILYLRVIKSKPEYESELEPAKKHENKPEPYTIMSSGKYTAVYIRENSYID